jgi:hypothetical protein
MKRPLNVSAEVKRRAVGRVAAGEAASAVAAACEGKTAGGRGAWQAAVFEVIRAMTVSQGSQTVQRLVPADRGEPGRLLPVWRAVFTPTRAWPWPCDADDTFLATSQHSEDTASGYIRFRKLTQRTPFGMYLERCHVVQHHFQAPVG